MAHICRGCVNFRLFPHTHVSLSLQASSLRPEVSKWTTKPSRRKSGTPPARSGTGQLHRHITEAPSARCWCTISRNRYAPAITINNSNDAPMCVCGTKWTSRSRAREREREKELTVHAMICTCVCVCVCERRLLLRISRDGSVSCANMPILRCVVVVTATWPCAHPHAHSPPRVCFSGSSNDTFTHASCRHPPCTCTDCHHARRQQG